MNDQTADPLDALRLEGAASKKGLSKERSDEAVILLRELLRNAYVDRFFEYAAGLEKSASEAVAEEWQELPEETRKRFASMFEHPRFRDSKMRGTAFALAANVAAKDPGAGLSAVRLLARVATNNGTKAPAAMDANHFRESFLESGALFALDTGSDIAAVIRPVLALAATATFGRNKKGKPVASPEMQARTLKWFLANRHYEKLPEAQQKLVSAAVADWPREMREAFVEENGKLPFEVPAAASQPQPPAAPADPQSPTVPQEPAEDFAVLLDRLRTRWEKSQTRLREIERDSDRCRRESETALGEARREAEEARSQLDQERARSEEQEKIASEAKQEAEMLKVEKERLTSERAAATAELSRLRELLPIERRRAVEGKLDEIARDLTPNHRDFLAGEGREMSAAEATALEDHIRDLYERLRRHGLRFS